MLFFFFNDTATTEIYTLSLHDALPIFVVRRPDKARLAGGVTDGRDARGVRILRTTISVIAFIVPLRRSHRSEEHTSELQSQSNLVCRLLLEKKRQLPYPRVYYNRRIMI